MVQRGPVFNTTSQKSKILLFAIHVSHLHSSFIDKNMFEHIYTSLFAKSKGGDKTPPPFLSLILFFFRVYFFLLFFLLPNIYRWNLCCPQLGTATPHHGHPLTRYHPLLLIHGTSLKECKLLLMYHLYIIFATLYRAAID